MSNQIVTASLYGLGGLGAGIAYYLGNHFLNGGVKAPDIETLGVEVEAIQQDRTVFDLLVQFHEFRKVDPVHFSCAVQHIDKLILLHMQLFNKVIVPSFRDRSSAETDFRNGANYLRGMVTKAKNNHMSPAMVAKMSHLYKLIFKHLQNHFEDIMRLTHVI